MKKIFTLIFATAFTFNCTYANNDLKGKNDKKPVTSFQKRFNSANDNWFVSAGVGAQAYFGDHDKQIGLGKRITPKFEITGGKWFNDDFAVRINVNTAKMKGLTQYGGTNGLSTGKKYRDEDDLWYQEFNYINAHADFMFNWTNDALGVDPNRKYDFIPYVGVGFVTVTNKQKGTSFTPNLGFINSFKINDKFSIDVDVKGNLFADKVDGELGGRNLEGAVSVMAGLRYSFK